MRGRKLRVAERAAARSCLWSARGYELLRHVCKASSVLATVLHCYRRMFKAAIVLFVLAIVAAVFGFGGIAASAAGLGKIAFFVFLVLAILGFIRGAMK